MGARIFGIILAIILIIAGCIQIWGTARYTKFIIKKGTKNVFSPLASVSSLKIGIWFFIAGFIVLLIAIFGN